MEELDYNVKLEYGLSVDPAERNALEVLLAGGEAQLTCVDTPPATTSPDLEVGSLTVSDSSPATGATFTLSATVNNSGDGESAATTLRFYRSTDATITMADTAEGTDAVAGLAAAGNYLGSVDLTAPSTAGTYYYGACIDAVTDESDITNNCSTSVQVTVSEPEPMPALPLLGQLLLALGMLRLGVMRLSRRGGAAASRAGDGLPLGSRGHRDAAGRLCDLGGRAGQPEPCAYLTGLRTE